MSFGRVSRWTANAAALAVAALVASGAVAQPVERNLPPAPTAPSTVIAPPPLPGSINDDKSLGTNLSSIVILGPTAAVEASPAPGVDTSQVARLNHPAAVATLRPFLGRPISRKLISQIEAQIVLEYRRQGYPFVEVSTPEQEITEGALQIRVVEFRVGKITVAPASVRQAADIERQIRTKPGDEIYTPNLSQDLDWLNRYPDRVVTPAFTPGATLAETDLDLAVSHPKPWSISAGYSNSGSPETGNDRYFVGGSIAGQLLSDTFLSVQVTGSPDFWATRWKFFSDPHPQYESVAGRLTAATWARQDIELTIDVVETNEPTTPFVIRQDTFEANLGYRSALSNIVPLPGDIVAGAEVSRQARHTFFGDTDVLDTGVDIFQFYGDWSDNWTDPLGSENIDASVHGSPGGLDGSNTAAAFTTFTNGRVTSGTYVYGQLNFGRQTKLPLGFGLVTQFNGQYAGKPIPDSQQIALGGMTSVRGYTLDDGAWDDGLVLRDELHAPTVTLVRRDAFVVDVAPMAFLDLGYGHDDGGGPQSRIASVGVGADFRVAPTAIVTLDVSDPLISAKSTQAGDTRLDVRLSVAY